MLRKIPAEAQKILDHVRGAVACAARRQELRDRVQIVSNRDQGRLDCAVLADLRVADICQ